MIVENNSIFIVKSKKNELGDKRTFEYNIYGEFESFNDEINLKDSTIKYNLKYLIPLMVKKHSEYINFFDAVDINYLFIEQIYLLSPSQVKKISNGKN